MAASILRHQIVSNREINDLKNRINNLEQQVQQAQVFIKEIESGNLDFEFDNQLNIDKDDHLAASLLSMRDQMRKIALEEKQRNWVTEGLAKFVDILRSSNEDIQKLGNVIISNIVKYLNANQGSLYIINDSDESDPHLSLIGCYAYDRNKHITQKIGIGEGLVGQCILEKTPIYMTNIPDNYLKITSGLGQALPKNLLIVPLLINSKAYGVIELASFSVFEKYHRHFVEKLGESIASTISNAHTNEKTRKLLTETQAQTEMMRSQEEEMRQNMEELSSTQEEMQRILKEVEGRQNYLNQLLNVSTDSIFTIDREYKLVSWNKTFEMTLQHFGIELQKGMNTLDWYQGDERKNQLVIYNRVLNGESFDSTASSEANGKTHYHLSMYAPLKNDDGEVYEAAIFAKDVTAMINAQKKAERLAAETQSKELYLNSLLNASKDSIFTVDKDLKLISYNDAFGEGLKQVGLTVEKGFFALDLFPDKDQKAMQKSYYERAFTGETFEITSKYDYNGVISYYATAFSPLKNEQNEVYAVAVFGKDLTELTTAKNNAEKLALEAHEKTEEIKAQEEELRQNLEELSATQEEMQRILDEVQSKESYLNSLIDASKDAIFTVDRDLRVISFNTAFNAGIEGVGMTIQKGTSILDIFPDESQKNKQKEFYKRAFKGESFDITNQYQYGDAVTYFNSSFSPLKNLQNEITAVAVFGKDLTELMVSKNAAERMAEEANRKTDEVKAQEEELRQNLEELSATQEEMQRIIGELENKNEYATSLLNTSDDMVFTVDKDLKLVTWNKPFEQMMSQYGSEIGKGFNTLSWYTEERQKKEQLELYKRVFNGESISSVFTSENDGKTLRFKTSYKPLINKDGKVYEAVSFTRDITNERS